MSLQFIIGSSGAGKTRRLYEDLIGQSIHSPEERFFAIVPEQFTMQTQKDIVMLHPNHGVMNIDIVSFERLAYRIFEECSVERISVLDDMGKSMVLRKVAAEKKKELKLFGSHLEKVGFIGELKSMMSEFFQYGITQDRLEEMIQSADSPLLRQKLADMLVLYNGFKEYSEGKFIAKEEILDVLCRVLPQSALIRGSVVTLDGFTGFTPIQYRILELLLKYCKKVVVTITMDPKENPYLESEEQHLFHLSKHTVCHLVDLAAQAGVGKEDDILLEACPVYRFKDSPALGFIEQELFRYHRKKYEEKWDERGSNLNAQLQIGQADTPLNEVEFIAGEIERLLKEEHYRYRDIAVVTGSLDNYSREIIRRFEENKIPCFIDYKKNIMGNPMVELLRSALSIIREDFSYESVFRYLKTGLVTDQTEELNRLENYVIALGIRGSKRWNSRWERVYRGAELLNLEELNAFKNEILEPLLPLCEVVKRKEATVKEMVEALVSFLMNLKTEEKLKELEHDFTIKGEISLAKEYSQVYSLVMELLDRLAVLLGDEKVGRKEFADILDAGFAEIKVGMIPAVVDRVAVGDITRTRLSHIKVLFFVGVNDGIIPAVSGRGGILTETERKRLKDHQVELAPTAREEGFLQRLYLYLVMCKPSDKLYLSYSSMTSEGKSLRPSGLIGQVKKLFPTLSVTEIPKACMVPWAIPLGKKQLIKGLKEYGTMSRNEHFLELFRFFFRSEVYRDEVSHLVEAAFYTYEDHGIGRAAAREIYSAILQGSVTRMEQYASCAYAHFLSYGLELKERPVYELAAVDIGNLFHSSIDRFFKQMQEEKRSFRELPELERKNMVKSCVAQVSEEYGNTILRDSARNRYLEKKVCHITDRTIWALIEQIKQGDFEPNGFEVSFTPDDNLKAMKIPISDEEAIHLRGRIDRIDLCEDGDCLYLKIIDYKTGKKQFDLTEVYYGLQMQLVVYMDAALEKEQRSHPNQKVIPAGIFYYNISDPMVDKRDMADEDAVKFAILKQLRMNGLVNNREDIIRHLDHGMEKESNVIPVTMKDGVVQDAKSSVAMERQFESIRGFVNQKLKNMGREILDGRIAVDPYKKGTQAACDYCPYHSVCGFDLKTEGYGYRRFKKLKPEEVWQEIMPEDHSEEVETEDVISGQEADHHGI